jgi:hypothetical protein
MPSTSVEISPIAPRKRGRGRDITWRVEAVFAASAIAALSTKFGQPRRERRQSGTIRSSPEVEGWFENGIWCAAPRMRRDD